ncbi:MAG: bifunctional phosphopantothenoylcysteine decarboxylase/phosphopantothenate--cysteine ligase CoaBC [Bacteroidales bacterium]|nr:bifunctional phosphopantothenoylcysteine decarboxylase/phosphopantothenate--cysteine ligase CoaBC [Bacteroidales bacterium]
MFSGKKILIAVTGSIAAYKIAYLVRLLVTRKAEVRVVMTPAAKDFITPLTLATLSNNPVLSKPFNQDDGSWNCHVDLGNWPDVMLVAPLTANTLAKMAHGITDNFFLSVYLSAKCPVFFAPAMDIDMYKHPATSENIRKLKSFGHYLIEPQVGELASGLSGPGRMEEPEKIVHLLNDFFQKKRELIGKTVLISAGPTFEAIDPVRFIGNYSSGLMGYALAEEALKRGAEVILVSGPTHVEPSSNEIKLVNVVSAEDMFVECDKYFHKADISIMTAAVADYTPSEPSGKKIKKEESIKSIEVKPTKDILSSLGQKKRKDQFLVGFALETDDEVANAVKKLHNKKLDLIVLNSLRDEGAGFGKQTNKITIIDKDENLTHYPLKEKSEVAKDVIDKILELAKK